MRRYLKHLLCAGATLLAFYAGYGGLGVTRAHDCTVEAACQLSNCMGTGPIYGCFNTNGTQITVCVPTGNVNDTCQAVDPVSQYTCNGANSNGFLCSYTLTACTGPCPPP
jgi:hypothetical protein